MLEFKLQKKSEEFKKLDNLKKQFHKYIFCKYINVNTIFVNTILYFMLLGKTFIF